MAVRFRVVASNSSVMELFNIPTMVVTTELELEMPPVAARVTVTVQGWSPAFLMMKVAETLVLEIQLPLAETAEKAAACLRDPDITADHSRFWPEAREVLPDGTASVFEIGSLTAVSGFRLQA